VDKVLVRWSGARVTTGRALQVGGILVLLLLGVVLPYLHHGALRRVVRGHQRDGLAPQRRELTGLDATFLPSYDPEIRPDFNVAFNVLGSDRRCRSSAAWSRRSAAGGLFYDEINKFFWWPLHLSATC
jgi:hypothetical protein